MSVSSFLLVVHSSISKFLSAYSSLHILGRNPDTMQQLLGFYRRPNCVCPTYNIHTNHGVVQDVQMGILHWGRVDFQVKIIQENKAFSKSRWNNLFNAFLQIIASAVIFIQKFENHQKCLIFIFLWPILQILFFCSKIPPIKSKIFGAKIQIYLL